RSIESFMEKLFGGSVMVLMSIGFIWFGIKLDKESYEQHCSNSFLFNLFDPFSLVLSISYILCKVFMIGLGVLLLYLTFSGKIDLE
ncbi:hypothetical protein, partial [Bacillus sp. CDB3]|uniref:hypothetical protein n=1 Tax=Bacillus sp. CDB3 TaxID=360310 RepID=UPI002119666A